MKQLSGSNLISDLLNSLVVFDVSGGIILAGDWIYQILAEKGIFITNLGNTKEINPEGQHLLNAIKSVYYEKYVDTIRFEKLDLDFTLFKAKFLKQHCVILCIKQEMDQISRIQSDLTERVKELECLYNISDELENISEIGKVLPKCLVHVQEGFQFPEITCVRIILDGKTYCNTTCEATEHGDTMVEPLFRNKKKIGEIAVWYKRTEKFLAEEYDLLREIATKISLTVEKREKQLALEKRRQALTKKNEKLLELTEECRQSREQLQTFFSAITDDIVVIDPQFNIVMSNKDEIGETGKCYNKLFGQDEVCDDCPAIRTFTTALSASSDRPFDDKFYRLFSYPIMDAENKVSSVLEVCRDVTQQKLMEAQLLQSYKLASLGKLVAGVAHEINNPNTFILGNIKIIKEAFEDILPILDEYHEQNPDFKVARLNYKIFRDNISILTEDMVSGSIRMKKIVEDLRNFAKKDDELTLENVKLNTLIENSVRLINKQVKKNVEIKLNLADDIPDFQGRNAKIQQVLVNLILNASQAIDKNEGVIEIETQNHPGGKSVGIIVRDNGKGMDSKTKKYIFDPFYTTKRNSGGTGLGLSITYGIIKEHKGSITVDSTPGKGTQFTITLPVKK